MEPVQMTAAERKEWALKIQRSVTMLQAHVPQDGTVYLGAFSGGKDSVAIYELAKMAEVEVEWHYHFTTIDPPELVQFIKTVYPDVIFDYSRFASGEPRGHLLTSRAVKVKGWPQAGGKRSRWCCSEYKEYGGEGRTSVVGVRIEESERRKSTWTSCFMPRLNKDGKETGKILMPIRLWTEKDVWAFIQWRGVSYCELYDEGFDRLGCVGCPELTPDQRETQFARWPAIEHQWSEMFRRRWELKAGTIDKNGKEWWGSRNFYSWEQLYQWWRETAGRISVTRWFHEQGLEPKNPE